MQLIHHGAHEGVTGSCHQLKLDNGKSFLIDCGIFQGADARRHPDPEIDFSLSGIDDLILTHVHIDHVGRLPYLLAAGFRGNIWCSRPTAKLLPLVMEDSLKIGFTRDRRLIEKFLDQIGGMLRPIDYHRWQDAPNGTRIRLIPAGHILGSAVVEIDAEGRRAVFSGDVGASHTPILKDPVSPEKADLLVLESTYGDKLHEDRETRQQRLEQILRRTLDDKGVTIIPAFSLGRTQELLYEMNLLFERLQQREGRSVLKAVDVIVDSPLASRFTQIYADLTQYWDAEGQRVLRYDDQPLVFENLTTVGDHGEHRSTVDYLEKSGVPAIVIAASGMCTGGRVVNYLQAFLDRPNTDVLFVGYQAYGTPGRAIQDGHETVELYGKHYPVKAHVHRIGGYSAHADQQGLLDFVTGMKQPPGQIVLVHGEDEAKAALTAKLLEQGFTVG